MTNNYDVIIEILQINYTYLKSRDEVSEGFAITAN